MVPPLADRGMNNPLHRVILPEPPSCFVFHLPLNVSGLFW